MHSSRAVTMSLRPPARLRALRRFIWRAPQRLSTSSPKRLRRSLPSYGQWCSVELAADRGNAVFIPAGCAHGFQTLIDGTELMYCIDVPYDAQAAAGIRWDDPSLAIDWPLADPILSARDRALPYLA